MAYRRKSSRRSTARRSNRTYKRKTRVSRRRSSYSSRSSRGRGTRDVRIIVQQAAPQLPDLSFMRPAPRPKKAVF